MNRNSHRYVHIMHVHRYMHMKLYRNVREVTCARHAMTHTLTEVYTGMRTDMCTDLHTNMYTDVHTDVYNFERKPVHRDAERQVYASCA